MESFIDLMCNGEMLSLLTLFKTSVIDMLMVL